MPNSILSQNATEYHTLCKGIVTSPNRQTDRQSASLNFGSNENGHTNVVGFILMNSKTLDLKTP